MVINLIGNVILMKKNFFGKIELNLQRNFQQRLCLKCNDTYVATVAHAKRRTSTIITTRLGIFGTYGNLTMMTYNKLRFNITARNDKQCYEIKC